MKPPNFSCFMQKLLLFGALVALLFSCKNAPDATALPYLTLEGKTMGTYYRITYGDSLNRNFQPDIEQFLQDFNQEVSTYIPTSTISQFNQSETGIDIAGKAYFIGNIEKSRIVFEQSGGAFDPTVMPLVNYWGFGYTPKKPVTQVDSAAVDSLRRFVGMHLVTLDGTTLRKALPGVQLDFSAIAKGYAIDEIAEWLEQRGVQHYLIDIGGEARAKGGNARGATWTIGINLPKEDAAATDLQTAVELRNRAIATSGNYRNFYEVDGVKYGHEINPATGYPKRTRLLSASVFAADCATADAWATAFMIMGLEKSLVVAEQLPHIEAYFIYGAPGGDLQTRYTQGLETIFGAEKQSANQ